MSGSNLKAPGSAGDITAAPARAEMGVDKHRSARAAKLAEIPQRTFMQLVSLLDRRHRIWDVLEYALSQERRFVVAMMLEHYPAVGRKLLKSLQRKDGPRCRVRKQKQKTAR